MRSLRLAVPAVLSGFLVSAGPSPALEVQSLAGEWRFAMGAPAAGKTPEALPAIDFADTIQLPGTTETRGKGKENPARESKRLTRLRHFDGPAWYQREVTVPEAWKGKRVSLLLERTKYTQAWLDDKPLGEETILCTPQVRDLGPVAPGPHRLTILVDNARRPPINDPHQLSDQTQTNWNGILGRIELQATDPVWIGDVEVQPDVAKRAVRVMVTVRNATGQSVDGSLTLTPEGGMPTEVVALFDGVGQREVVELRYDMKANALLWDEFSPALYRLTVDLQCPAGKDRREVDFGLREFKVKNGQFTINGRPTFLRGKHDGCVFPLTGHPPMDVEGWRTYLQTCKAYGLNHIRCHTWTPPEAALDAADRLGIYFQPELPYWGGFNAKVRDVLMPEAERILKAYGNHPSFVMFSLGNELGGERPVMAEMVRALRALDPRHLYVQGSNNYFWDPKLNETDDYWTTFRTRTAAGIRNSRGSYATVDGGNGLVQVGPPGTRGDFREANAGIPVPVVGHETGQFTVYPDFSEIPKYTGVTRARNFEIIRGKLTAKGMADQADAFVKASGILAVLCYREDIEAALRTPGFGGFQLLDLQDFPGQGTALVGVLNAFMESKGLIAPEAWRQFCGPVVPLARFDRYAWTTDEPFAADVEVAHYGPADLPGAVLSWSIASASGVVASGSLPAADVKQGNVRALGKIAASFAAVKAPARLGLEVKLVGGGSAFVNRYPLWVYPPKPATDVPAGVTLARDYDAKARETLAAGGRVLLIPPTGGLGGTVGGGFATDFWCWPMFKNVPGTMGILCDPKHPALAGFPTESHSDWQWFHIAREARPVILDATPAAYRPIVQVIDNLDRNHKLGLVFEAKVGTGRLLVCACDLPRLQEKPEARQLMASLAAYAASDAFNPAQELTPDALKQVFPCVLTIGRKSSASSSRGDYTPEKACDGDETTRWCAEGGAVPQWWSVDLGGPASLRGAEILWEFDKPGYQYALEGSADGQAWTVLSDQRQNKMKGRHALTFAAAGIRHLRVSITGLPKDNSWASIKEFRAFGE